MHQYNTNSLDCKVYPCTLDISGVYRLRVLVVDPLPHCRLSIIFTFAVPLDYI